MSVDVLKTEISSDPLGRGYAGMTDAEVADSLNASNRTRNVALLTGSEVLNAMDRTEYNAKTAGEKALVWDILHLGDLNPFGVEADLMVDVFGIGSNTITALQALRVQSISRAEELGVVATVGKIQEARS